MGKPDKTNGQDTSPDFEQNPDYSNVPLPKKEDVAPIRPGKDDNPEQSGG
jgi:hypothetical protein